MAIIKKRNLQYDLNWLKQGQNSRDLSDDYLAEKRCQTRKTYCEGVYDFSYGITFVESTIAREWLERAIEAERKLQELTNTNK